jgi:transposase
MGFISANRKQKDLIGYSLEDFIPKDAKCRFIVDIVSQLDLKKLYNHYSPQGADAYDPAIMLSTWFYGYTEGFTGTRKLEKLCKRDMHFIYVSANLRPDHCSFSRFRKDHLHLFPYYFEQIIRIARQRGYSDFKVIATDSSRIHARSSVKKSKDSDKLARYLTAVRKDIQEYIQLCELDELDDEPADDQKEIKKNLQRLRKLEKTLIERQHQLDERKKQIKKEYRDKHQINITEPDAYLMNHVNGKQSAPAYNAQVSVDTKTQLIVAQDVVQDRNDSKQFSRQHQAVEKNVGKDTEREHINDSGYHSLEQLEYIEENQVNATIADPTLVNNPKTSPQSPEEIKKQARRLKKSDFSYHADGDYFTCPVGEKLTFTRYNTQKNRPGRQYRASNCNDCKLKSQCLASYNKSGLRSIFRDDKEHLAEKMRQKLQTEDAKQKLKLRSITVEPVIGNLKSNLGFRRFHIMGLPNVKGEFTLMCIAHNLNKLYGLLLCFYFLIFFKIYHDDLDIK